MSMDTKIFNKITSKQNPITQYKNHTRIVGSQGYKDSSMYTNQSMCYTILTNSKVKTIK